MTSKTEKQNFRPAALPVLCRAEVCILKATRWTGAFKARFAVEKIQKAGMVLREAAVG